MTKILIREEERPGRDMVFSFMPVLGRDIFKTSFFGRKIAREKRDEKYFRRDIFAGKNTFVEILFSVKIHS